MASTDLPVNLLRADGEELLTLEVPPYPRLHELEPDFTIRHELLPGHDQSKLAAARVICVGVGANSWAALGLVRAGVRDIVLIDPDRFDSTNLNRQLAYEDDRGRFKAHAVAANLAPHAVGGARITGIALPFAEALRNHSLDGDLFVCLVDDNECRLSVSEAAIALGVPAVFGGLSPDGARCYAFLQEHNQACLHCCYPDLPFTRVPCAGAVINSCFLVVGLMLNFAHRVLMGWHADASPYNLREIDLLARMPDVVAVIERRRSCPTCGSPR